MTTEEKDRLEIVKEVYSLQNCTRQEIYNFIKTGKASATVLRACLKTNVNNKLSISQYFRHLCFGDCLNK